jgi:hypothetical protein
MISARLIELSDPFKLIVLTSFKNSIEHK